MAQSYRTQQKGSNVDVKLVSLGGAPTDGASLLGGIVKTLERFVFLAPDIPVAVALWIVHAHAHEAFDVSPILLINSPVKGCGKTTLLDVIKRLVPRPMLSASTSAAALYRSTSTKPTILVDEGDLYFSESPSLVAFFNAGHTRGTPFRRCEGKDHHPVEFVSWTPKVLAQIGKPRWPTIIDRSIVIPMQRKLIGVRLERLRASRAYPEILELGDMAAQWSADHIEALQAREPRLPDFLGNRAADNWEPLFAIAEEAGGDWPGQVAETAKTLQCEDEDQGIELLRDLREAFGPVRRSTITFLPTDEIVEILKGLPERPYKTINNGREINGHWLARRLRPFGLTSRQDRLERGKKARGYALQPFEGVFARYLTPTEASGASEAEEAE